MKYHVSIAFLLSLSWFVSCHAADKPVSVEQIQQDLRLTLSLSPDASFTPHDYKSYPQVTYAVVNHSETATYPIVLPGDGSECGWREPNVSYQAWFRPHGHTNADAEWQVLPTKTFGRCGLFDADWHDEIVQIPPQGRNIDERWGYWAAVPWSQFIYPSAGTVRIQATYTFSRGEQNTKIPEQSAGLAGMSAIPAYTLQSNVVEVKVSQGSPKTE